MSLFMFMSYGFCLKMPNEPFLRLTTDGTTRAVGRKNSQVKLKHGEENLKKNDMLYLNGSASRQREFVMIFGAAFTDKRTGASSVEIGIDNAVKRLAKFQIHFHGS